MAFELFNRSTVRRTTEPRVSLTKQGTLQLNAATLAQFFEGVDFVQLLFDAKTRRVALKPATKKDEQTYKLSRAKQGTGHVSASAFLKHYGIKHDATKSYPVKWLENPGAVVLTVK
jgi:hypothetical protein